MDVRSVCLGVLSQGAATGYEIKKQFEQGYSHFFRAGFGSIYPALNRLMAEGMVECQRESQDKRPAKKVYRITPTGRLALLRELSKPTGEDRHRSEFLVVMRFAELLPPSLVSEVIERYLTHHRERIARIEGCRGANTSDGGREFVCGFGIAVHKAITEYVEENRHLAEGAALKHRLERTG